MLLLQIPLLGTQNTLYFETTDLPADYLEYKRVSTFAETKCCKPETMTVYLAEEANVDELLDDQFRKPSYEWGETFCTLMGNKIRIYTANDFDVYNPTLTYYRKPRYIQIANAVDPYTGLTSTTDVICEFKDDIVELLIDEAASILAGDIESANQFARGTQSAERNN